MNRIFFIFIICAISSLSCSKGNTDNIPSIDEEEIVEPPNDPGEEEGGNLDSEENAAIEAIIKEYNIQKKGVKIESFVKNSESTILFVNGRIEGCLWVGCYDTTTKEMMVDFTETSKLDKTIRYNLGYGEYLEFDVEKYSILRFPYFSDNSVCFILAGHEREGHNNSACDLYFIENNTLKNKHRSVSTLSNSKYYQSVIPWYNGVMVKIKNGEYQCLNMAGESLFTIENNNLILECEPVNYEECIYFNFNADSNGFSSRRINIKTDNVIWNNGFVKTKLQEKIEIENLKIEKNGSIWNYRISYIDYEGVRDNLQISLNIDNGDYEIK